MATAEYSRYAYLFFQLRKSPLTVIGLAIILLMCLAVFLHLIWHPMNQI